MGTEPASPEMLSAVRNLCAALPPAARDRMCLPFSADERFVWNYTPVWRPGLALAQMDPAARLLAHALIASGLSAAGYRTAATIMSLEKVLREIEHGRGFVRDPEGYYLTVFGEPSVRGVWGWRFEGHHLSLHFTLVDGQVAGTPSFFGANPATVPGGPRAGLRALAPFEDLARELLDAIGTTDRAALLISSTAPDDLLTTNQPSVAPFLPPEGIAASELPRAALEALLALLDLHAAVMPAEIAAARREAIRGTPWETLRFAWAGGMAAGARHYYRVQAPAFLVEYDNTQDGANHIHTVWREYDGDFGRDLLAEHRATAHREPTG